MSQSMGNLHTLNMRNTKSRKIPSVPERFSEKSDCEWGRRVLEQNRSSHSYGYDFHDIYPTFFVIFSRNSVPFMKYAGSPAYLVPISRERVE